MAEFVTVRNEFGEERQVRDPRFFVNQGFKVLDSAGRVNSKATSAATTSEKGSN